MSPPLPPATTKAADGLSFALLAPVAVAAVTLPVALRAPPAMFFLAVIIGLLLSRPHPTGSRSTAMGTAMLGLAVVLAWIRGSEPAGALGLAAAGTLCAIAARLAAALLGPLRTQAGPEQVLTAAALTAMAMAVFDPALLGPGPGPLQILALCMICSSAAALINAAGRLSPLRAAGMAGIALLPAVLPRPPALEPTIALTLPALLLLLIALVPSRAVSFLAGAMLTAFIGVLYAGLGMLTPSACAGVAALTLALPLVAARQTEVGPPEPPAQLRDSWDAQTTNWLARLDLQRRTVAILTPLQAGEGAEIPFATCFPEGPPIVLMSSAPPAGPLPLAVLHPDLASGQRHRVGARILARDNRHLWLMLSDRRAEHALTRERDLAHERLADAALREERLLAVASHELRTPVASLSMLSEELRHGAGWDQVAPRFDPLMQRILTILDDLRGEVLAQGPATQGQVFTLRGICEALARQWHERSPDRPRLQLLLPSSLEQPLQGDVGRLLPALMLILAHVQDRFPGQPIVLTPMLLARGKPVMTLAWHVSPTHASGALPPAAEPAAGDATLPLILQRAVSGLGATLTGWPITGVGTISLCHPLRHPPADAPPAAAPQGEAVEPVAPHALRGAALLIEDNPLVGEITRSRLARLFHRVDWAQTGPEGLQLGLQGGYDMLFVDHLLPGLNGDEIVAAIRATGLQMPVIGVTASALGEECHALQLAGATIAIEKPLGFAMMQQLVEQYCPARPASTGTPPVSPLPPSH